MWAGPIRGRWVCAGKSIRKDSAFLRCESCAGGRWKRDVLALLLNNVRTPDEREGDLGAQIAACHTGAERLLEVCERYGLERARSASRHLLDYSEQMMRAFLARVPKGRYCAEDFMDSDGISDRPVKIAVAVKFERPARDESSPRATR